ncbi:TetR/AcrR family transcriptional regulator [Paenibacillus hamazuiensis]|uniref:TetR/AcrR family transcriptional regulator n=1 Tax=Paenibacillus hamazuiensis TaxID=2936508 RepID=UPI00200E28A1|nr:TetR/AcrR family transcriptional regulator [Paenibacillus hamazuiensis]
MHCVLSFLYKERRGKKINQSKSSSERLLRAVIDLVAEKGYHGVSTKEIAAAAGVNEVTLFRQFGSKQKLLETAFHHFHYSEVMTKLFQEELVGELYPDLLLISRSYQKTMNRNRKIIQIALKESHIFAEFQEKANKHPQKLKELLTGYFNAMQAKGKMISTNSELQALTFMWMNYGAFISNLNADDSVFPSAEMEAFIEESARTLTRALTP